MYTPICISKAEWVSLVLNYEHFCFTDNWAWIWFFFDFSSTGHLPKERLEGFKCSSSAHRIHQRGHKGKAGLFDSRIKQTRSVRRRSDYCRKQYTVETISPKELIDLNNRPPHLLRMTRSLFERYST